MHLMSLRTKIILLSIAAITALATVFAATYQPRRVETIARPLVKIGVYLPLTGANAHLGLSTQNAIEQLLKQTSSSARYKYEAEFIDLNENRKPLGDPKALLTFDNLPEPRVTMIIGSENPDRFTFHSPYEIVSNLLVKDLNRRNVKNIGLITMAKGEYRKLARIFKDSLPESYQLIGAVFQPGQTDFSILINLLRNNDTDLFVLTGAPAEIDNLTAQLHDGGVSNFNISTLYNVELTAKPHLYENTRSVGSLAGDYDNEMAVNALKMLIEAYEKNFKKDYLPNTKIISDYISAKYAPDKIIAVPAALKIVKDGKITIPKE